MIYIRNLVFLTLFLLFNTKSLAQESDKNLDQTDTQQKALQYRYTYIDREHSTSETFKHLAIIYGVSWAVYPLTQPSTVIDDGSFDKYKRNFGQLVFDKDEPFWNWFVHPLSGSQLYLYYRANGYDKTSSTALAFVSSSLFEFTIEIYTEPASVQDLYQTPILGSIIGVGIEHLSLYLLNSGTTFGTILGHTMNPATLFDFYEGKVHIVPQTDLRTWGGVKFMAEF